MISAAAGVTLKSAGGIRSSANLESIFWKSSLSSGFSNKIEIAPLRPNPVTQDEMDAGSIELF